MQNGLTLPHLWLFTDERVGTEALLNAIGRLPRGSGVVFRHYSWSLPDRRALLRTIVKITRRRRLILLIAGQDISRSVRDRAGWHIPGWKNGHHRPRQRRNGLLSMPAHSPRDIKAARRAGADLIFMSPAFATQSHPGAPFLGAVRFGLMCRHSGTVPVIALGGMTGKQFRRLRALGAYGWAAIDALTT